MLLMKVCKQFKKFLQAKKIWFVSSRTSVCSCRGNPLLEKKRYFLSEFYGFCLFFALNTQHITCLIPYDSKTQSFQGQMTEYIFFCQFSSKHLQMVWFLLTINEQNPKSFVCSICPFLWEWELQKWECKTKKKKCIKNVKTQRLFTRKRRHYITC